MNLKIMRNGGIGITKAGIAKITKKYRAPEELIEKRLEICRGCSKRNIKKSKLLQGRKVLICSICHCFLNAKTILEDSTCPLGKW